MQQQVGIGTNPLVGQLRLAGVGTGSEGGNVAGHAVGLGEQTLAGQHLRVVHLAPRRDRQVAAVEQHLGEDVVADFRLAAVGRPAALDLGGAAVVVGQQAAGQAHVVGEGVRVLLRDIRLAGLPAEAAERGALPRGIPDLVGAPADTVAVAVVRIGIGQDRLFGNRLEQAEADHRRGDAGGKHRLRMHRPIAELADTQDRLAQFDLGAVLEPHLQRLVVHPHLAFRGDAGNADVLQLAAVGRLGNHPLVQQGLAVRRAGRDRQAYQHRHRADRVRSRRVAAAVLHMAVLAGVGIEQRSQTVARGGGGRGDDPGVAEETVAHAEVQAPARGEVGGGQGEGVAVALQHRGRAPGQVFAGLGAQRFVVGAASAQKERRQETGERHGR